MAPAASNTIAGHFRDFENGPLEYDKIITGDLGYVGQEILIDLLKKEGYDISQKHMDCGKGRILIQAEADVDVRQRYFPH